MRALRVLAVAACLLLLCLTASAEECAFTWREQGDGTVIITKWTGTGDQVTVPEKLDGKTVMGIAGGVFANKTNLTVSLPDGLTSFQADSFGYAPNLVKRVECHVNSDTAKSLVTVRFYDPDMPEFAFKWQRGKLQFLQYDGQSGEVELPEGVHVIGTNAFGGSGEVCVRLPDSVAEISERAFVGNNLTVYLPDSVGKVNTYAFGDGGVYPWAKVFCNPESDTARQLICPFRAPEAPACILRWVDGTLTLIGAETENGPVVLPETEVSIAPEVLAELPCLNLPDGIVTVEAEAFRGCGENRVVIPDGVESIGANAFADSPNLLMIRLPNSLRKENIDASCLSNCPRVTVCAPAGSEALQWARDLGFPVMAE